MHQGLRLGAAAGHRPHSMGRRDGRRRYVRGEEARFDGAVCMCIVWRVIHIDQSERVFQEFNKE